MIPIWIKDGSAPQPETPFYYVVAQNGIFMHKESPFWRATVPLDGISILEPQSPTLTLLLPKIPKKLVEEVIHFFASLSHKHNVEAIVLLLWDTAEHRYTLLAPHQIVSSERIKRYDIPRQKYPLCIVGTFHSHARHPAFHSKTDCRDEESMDGIHGTFGSFRGLGNLFSVSINAVVNGTRFDCNPMDLLEGIIPSPEKESAYSLEESGQCVLPDGYSIPTLWYENIYTITSCLLSAKKERPLQKVRKPRASKHRPQRKEM
ncbi:MAG: Mov34/MPN/PAD-1 family protein [Parcubacteria group bacterium]|nr:Mov34/MPN/PAD-1 family protein [Parcubacteria group bacterium]